MIRKGFCFGMLLQIAVGPVCLYIFQTAAAAGFAAAFAGVAGVARSDALYILAAIGGLGAAMDKLGKAKAALRYFGAAVLFFFGLANVLGVLGIVVLPGHTAAAGQGAGDAFLKALLLTLSNPLTILFWAGVFSSRLSGAGLQKRKAYAFGSGAVLSTVLFLTDIAALGTLAQALLAPEILDILNAAVGLALIGFGLKTLCKKKTTGEGPGSAV